MANGNGNGAAIANGNGAATGPMYSLAPVSRLLAGSRSLATIISMILDQAFITPFLGIGAWFEHPLPDPCIFRQQHGVALWKMANKDPAFDALINDGGMVSDSSFIMEIAISECGEVFQGITSLLEPRVDPEEGGDEGRVEDHGYYRGQAPRADEEAGHRREGVHGPGGGAVAISHGGREDNLVLLDTEDARDSEHAHEVAQVGDLGGVYRDPGNYLWEGGSAAMLVDGISEAEVQRRGLDSHRLDLGEGGSPELVLGVDVELGLVGADQAVECHD